MHGYISSVLYINKGAWRRLLSCESEEGQEGGWYIGTLIDIIGMPYLLHTENTDKFKDYFLSNMIKKKMMIYQTSLSCICHSRIDPKIQ